MTVKISVLLATFNGAKHVHSQLQSITDQTRPPDELVICDDGSTDTTLEIVREFAAHQKFPVHVHLNEANKGYRRNFLDGFSMCSGDYVALCDQDDVWLPEKIASLAARVKSGANPSLIFSDCRLVDEHLNDLGIGGLARRGISELERESISGGNLIYILLSRPCITGMTMFCNRQRVLDNIPAMPEISHDFAISLGFALGGDYAFVDQPLVKYRQHSNNALGMSSRKQRKPSLFRSDFVSAAESDLLGQRELIAYLRRFNPVQTDKLALHIEVLNQYSDFIDFRAQRRRKLQVLLRGSRAWEQFQLNPKERRKMFLKDMRGYVRLKVHRLIAGLGLLRS